MTDKFHCELHGLQDGACIVCARLDLNGMRDFQAKFIKADSELQALRAVVDAAKEFCEAYVLVEDDSTRKLLRALKALERAGE